MPGELSSALRASTRRSPARFARCSSPSRSWSAGCSRTRSGSRGAQRERASANAARQVSPCPSMERKCAAPFPTTQVYRASLPRDRPSTRGGWNSTVPVAPQRRTPSARACSCVMSSISPQDTTKPAGRRKAKGPEPIGPGPSHITRRPRLHRLHVLRLQALRALGHVEGHLLTLGQGTETFPDNGGVVAEDICAAVVLRDEAKALRIVEPLHGTSRHLLFALSVFRPRRAAGPATCGQGGCR